MLVKNSEMLGAGLTTIAGFSTELVTMAARRRHHTVSKICIRTGHRKILAHRSFATQDRVNLEERSVRAGSQ